MDCVILRRLAASAVVVLAAGCGGDGEPEPAAVDGGTLELGNGASVNYECRGDGGPPILFEAGTGLGGTESGYYDSLLDRIAEATTVCTYDRPGTYLSDPAPRRRRTMADLCAVQDQVVTELRLARPYVLAGQSGGGNLSIGCAARRGGPVAAVVTIDSYHDDPAELRAAGFDWHDNTEHVDYIDYSRELDELTMPIGDFPVLVVSATEGDPGGVDNQRYWLGLSPDSRQVEVEGEHDIHATNPGPIVDEILDLLDRLQGAP